MRKETTKMKKIIVNIGPNDYVYEINVVSSLVKLPVWTIRTLVKEGLIKPKRVGKKKRLFCLRDIQRLEEIRRLLEEDKIHLIKKIMQLLEE